MIILMFANLASTPVNLFATLNIVGLLLLSLLSLRLAQKESNGLHRRVYSHWSLGFFLMIWDRVPIVLGALGMDFVAERLLPTYFFIFICYVVGLMLLTRGLLLLFTENRWLIKVIPVVIIVSGALLTAISFLWLGSPAIGLWFAKIFTYITVIMNTGISITLLIVKRKTFRGWSIRAGLVLISLAWLVMLASRAYFFRLLITSTQSWFNLVQQVPEIYQVLLLAQILMFCGIFLLGHHRESSGFRSPQASAVLVLDVAIVGLLLALLALGSHSNALIAASSHAEIGISTKARADIFAEKNFLLEVYVNSPVAFNTIEGKVLLPKELLLLRIDKASSNIPLWVDEPNLNTAGSVAWSGGIPGGASGKVRIFEMELKAGGPMQGTIGIADALVLANDGNGTPLQVVTRPFILDVLPSSVAAADLSGDGVVDIRDLSRLLAHWGESGAGPYDLSRNGKVDLADLSMLLSSFSVSGRGTRAFLP